MKLPCKIIVLLFFAAALVSCSNAAGSGSSDSGQKTFKVKNAYYNQDTGYLTVYTNCPDNVEFNLSILNATLSNSTEQNGRLTFDCMLVLEKEVLPTNSPFTITLSANGYSSQYENTYTYINIHKDPGVDTDKDGISDYNEIYRYFTDPMSPDTDGDSFTDFEELSMYDPYRHIFDPRIADIPKMEVEISDDFDIYYTYTRGTSEQKTSSSTKTQGTTHTYNDSYSNGTTSSNTHGWEVSGGGKHSWGVNASSEWHVEGKVNGSYTHSSSYTMTKSFAESSSTSISEGTAHTEGESRSITGGVAKTYIVLKNTSNITYTLTSLVLNLNRFTYSSNEENLRPIGKIDPMDLATGITLAPGDSRKLAITANLTTEEFESIANTKETLNISVTGYHYTITRLDAKVVEDFTEVLTKVKAKCAFVRIDYGPQFKSNTPVPPEEKYWISTKTIFNPYGGGLDDNYKTPSLLYGLKTIAGFTDEDLVLTQNNQLLTIKQRTAALTHADGDWYIQRQYTRNNATYEDMFNGRAIKEDGQVVETGDDNYDISQIPLWAGADYHIFYDEDNDNDYVPLNVENNYFSDDNRIDTDGDGISDYNEIHGWSREDNPGKIFRTNPSTDDTDGDALLDLVDPEPNIPEKSTETAIHICKITKSDSSASYDLSQTCAANMTTIKTSGALSQDKVTELDSIYDGITLAARAKIVYNKVACALSNQWIAPTYDTVAKTYANAAIFNGLDWKNFNGVLDIANPVGESYLWLKITSWDNRVVDYVPVAKIRSRFNGIKNFKATAATINNKPSVTFTFDAYKDSRSDVKISAGTETAYSGYVLYCKKIRSGVDGSSDIDAFNDKTLSINEITSSLASITSFTASEYFLKIENLRQGFVLSEFTPAENWRFKLFAYAQSDYATVSADSYTKMPYYNEILAATNDDILITKKDTGKLYFYPVYFMAVKDEDGGSDPQYYWTFSSDGGFDLNSLNKNSNNPVKMDDDSSEGRKYFIWDGAEGVTSGEPPTSCYNFKVESKEFTRNEDHRIYINISVSEYDVGSDDDVVGSLTLYLQYDKNTDSWSFQEDNTVKIVGYGESGRKTFYDHIKNESYGWVALKYAFEWR